MKAVSLPLKETAMHFEVSRAVAPGKQLTRAQMSSSHFDPEPRIGIHVLRRGSIPLKLTAGEMELSMKWIKKGLISQSIVVKEISSDGSVSTATGWDVKANRPIFKETIGSIDQILDIEDKKVKADVEKVIEESKPLIEDIVNVVTKTMDEHPHAALSEGKAAESESTPTPTTEEIKEVKVDGRKNRKNKKEVE